MTIVICKECSKKFEAPKHKHRQFCSNQCHIKCMIRERDKGKRVWWQCPICKKKFWMQRNEAKTRKYCSVRCQAIGASYRLRGKRLKKKVDKREIRVYPKPPRIYDKGVRKLLHRYLIEQKLGRQLKPSEIVHHIDMDKQNNTIKNLYLYQNESEHGKGHRTLDKTVKYLLDNGIIGFESGKYYLRDSMIGKQIA